MTDIFSSFVVWRGLSVAIQPPDSDHPYGHGKAEPLAASFVCLTLLAAALGIAIQAVREILRPHLTPSPFTLWLLLAVVIIKESLFRFAFRVGNQTSSNAVRTDAWHHRSDAITSAAGRVWSCWSVENAPLMNVELNRGFDVPAVVSGDGWKSRA